MNSQTITPTMRKLLDELKTPGTQVELAKRLKVHERTIRDIIKSLKEQGTEIPFTLKNKKQKVYYLTEKPVIVEEKKESESATLIKELLAKNPKTVYDLVKETKLSISRVREILYVEGIKYVKDHGKNYYYINQKPAIKHELNDTQKRIIKSIEYLPKTSAQLAAEIGIGFKAIRDSIKKITGVKIYQHKIQNIVHYSTKDFDTKELELKKDVKKHKILESISSKPITVTELARQVDLTTKSVYEKIIQLQKMGHKIKSKVSLSQKYKYYYIGKEPTFSHELTAIQEKILAELKKGQRTSMDLAKMFKVREETILDNIKMLGVHGHKIHKEKAYKKLVFSTEEPVPEESTEEMDELEEAAKATYLIPESSSEEPFIIKTQSKDYFKIGVANTVYGGIRTDKLLFKNFLTYCEQDSCDAVILNGNLIWMDLMTYSRNKPDRARISSRNIDPSFIEYPDTVKKFRDPTKLVENGETVYITFKEKLDMILQNELSPLFKDKEDLLFNKPVYILFGGMEDELRRQHTNLLNRIKNRKELDFVNSKLLSLKFAIDAAQDDEQLQKEYQDWEDYKGRIMMGNIDDVSTQKISRAMQGYIIQKLEAAIPNSKVISVGEGYVKANDTEIMVLYNAKKTSDSMSDHLINYAIAKVQTQLGSGKERAPDIVLTGGLSPYYVAKPITYATKNRGTKVTTIIQLPTCLEEEELKRLVKTSVSSKDVLTKLGSNNKLATGALILENHNGINKRKLLTSNFLTSQNIKRPSKTFYELDVSDEHVGSKFACVVEKDDDVLYFTEAYQKMLLDIKAPICRINNLGDEIQGLNYDVWKEKHPDFMETHELLNAMKKYPDQIVKITKLNSMRTGVLLPPDQVNLYIQIQNYNFLGNVLKTAEEENLYGGVLNFTEGNHSENTEGFQISSMDIQKELVYKLKADTSKITADMFGMTGMKESIFGIVKNKNLPKDKIEKENYLYAEYNRHISPGAKNKSYASMLLDRRLLRGRTFKDHEGRTLISRFGHLHTGLEAFGNNNLIISCYCGQERTDYGEARDYPLVVIGARIVGYPANGLSSGPLEFIDIFKYNLKDYFNGGAKQFPMLFN